MSGHRLVLTQMRLPVQCAVAFQGLELGGELGQHGLHVWRKGELLLPEGRPELRGQHHRGHLHSLDSVT